ncbi:MYND Zn-finger protein [Ceratobasidium sp. AG-Ba]|nr:MYND Zn-finger protein [Ceratobasidium sp. AG-Ba]
MSLRRSGPVNSHHTLTASAAYCPPLGQTVRPVPENDHRMQSAKGQVDMVGVLLKYLKLPDPSKRKGLRQFAVNFSSNNQKINNCYDAHRQPPHTDWVVLGAIVNLWAKLGIDSVLRDKLFANGMLNRMIPLLKEGDKNIRTSVLFALSNLTHHGGSAARKTIAELTTSTLIEMIADPECSARSAELSVAVLAHALGPTVMDAAEGHHIGDKVVIPNILRELNAERTCYAIGAIIRRTDVDTEAVSHAISLLKGLAFYFRDAILAMHVERAFIAALASKDIQLRIEGFTGILRVGSSVTESESRLLDPMRVAAIARNPEEYFTPELMQALNSQYGGLKGGMIYELADSSTALDAATRRLERSRDMAAFGRELCQRILTSEYSVAQGVMTGPGGHMESFATFFERAAQALEKSTDPADAHLPYVLRIKIAIASGDRHQITTLSSAAQSLFPDFAFFYYTQSIWTQESRVALRLAKKGLACSDLTDYVKRGLLHRSAESGYEMTLSGPFQLAAPGSPAWSEGVAILHCAQEDSKAYIEMTSLDQRNLKTVIYTYLCVTLMLEGDKVFHNLDMVRPYLVKLSLAEQIYAVVCRPLPYTERKLAVDLILPQFAKPLKQWREAITRLEHQSPHHHHHQQLPADDPDHVLANWLARTALDDENTPDSEYADLQPKAPERIPPGTSAKDVLVYRCSLCGNPSASLKKCGRCKQVRYCDDSCQRKHWKKGHKTVCKPA